MKDAPPDWSIVVPMFDETLQKIQCVVRGKKLQVGWDLFCMKVAVAWGYRIDGSVHFMHLVFPPIPVTGHSAEKLLAAMTKHPFTMPTERFLRALVRHTKHTRLRSTCLDSASPNEKLVRVLMERVGVTELRDWNPCMSHQGQIAMTQGATVVFGLGHLVETNRAIV